MLQSSLGPWHAADEQWLARVPTARLFLEWLRRVGVVASDLVTRISFPAYLTARVILDVWWHVATSRRPSECYRGSFRSCKHCANVCFFALERLLVILAMASDKRRNWVTQYVFLRVSGKINVKHVVVGCMNANNTSCTDVAPNGHVPNERVTHALNIMQYAGFMCYRVPRLAFCSDSMRE